jgi:hypothetical protein
MKCFEVTVGLHREGRKVITKGYAFAPNGAKAIRQVVRDVLLGTNCRVIGATAKVRS